MADEHDPGEPKTPMSAEGKRTDLEEAVNRFHPDAEGRPQTGAENSETPGERRARITARHQELKASGNRHPTKTVAEEERISQARARQLMKPARPVPKAR